VVRRSQVLAEETAAEETSDEPLDEHEDIRCKFLVEMPKDFYDLWELAKTVNPKAPSGECDFVVIDRDMTIILKR